MGWRTNGGSCNGHHRRHYMNDGASDETNGDGGGDDHASDDEEDAQSIDSADAALLELLGLVGGGGGSGGSDDDDDATTATATATACSNGERRGGGGSATAKRTATIITIDVDDEAALASAGTTSKNSVRSVDDLVSRIRQREDAAGDPSSLPSFLERLVVQLGLRRTYETQSYCVFPDCVSAPAHLMRRITEELIWCNNNNTMTTGSNTITVDKTYETVQTTTVDRRRVLTRLENFVSYHAEWKQLCCGYLRELVSALFGEPYVLYKEKLNLKPPGGSGFAPHLDTPSLRVAMQTVVRTDDDDGVASGPDCLHSQSQSDAMDFVTVMVSIDDMTVENGCLRIAPGAWNEATNCVEVIAPTPGASPDADGRAGAIPVEVAETLDFVDIACKGGTIVVFSGWAPHRSSANRSHFARRAVFLTYNRAVDGDWHDTYYRRMKRLREEWASEQRQQRARDDESDLAPLATIPRI